MSLRQGPISAPRARGDAPEGVVERVPLRLPGETGVEAQRGGREEKGGRKRGKGKGRERERWRTGNGERRRKGRDGESGTGKGDGKGEMGNRGRGKEKERERWGTGNGESGTGSREPGAGLDESVGEVVFVEDRGAGGRENRQCRHRFA